MLQGLCVAVTQEERKSSTEKMSEKLTAKMRGSPHNFVVSMRQQSLKKK